MQIVPDLSFRIPWRYWYHAFWYYPFLFILFTAVWIMAFSEKFKKR